jgi:dihydrodipicolinate synthase/N-acetylneuraminate lyase
MAVDGGATFGHSALVGLHGTLAASVTPLLAGGDRLDADAFGPLVDGYAAAGLDGILAFGTNGEGVLFSVEERRAGLRLFVEAAAGRLDVAAHCGAQTTADTVVLAADAAEAGAAAVAVIGPPYFPLDEPAQLAHFTAAAAACAPLPFYVYEFARTSGYAVALDVLRRLREEAPNLVGLKVSDTPWEAFEPYLSLGLDVFVGPEVLIHRGIEGGAVGAVSALASAFPEQVSAVVREPTADGAAALGALRASVERFPRQAAMKRILAARGVPVRADVRAPLRDLTADEARELAVFVASQ